MRNNPLTTFRKTRYTFGLLVVSLLILVVACQSPEPIPPTATLEPQPLEVFEYTDSAEFNLLYPSDWLSILPRPGMLLFGEEQTIGKSEPGALMTILLVPTNRVHGDLQGEFEHYLDFGPRRDGYVEAGEIEERELDGKPAFTVRMSQPGDGEFDPFETEITAVELDNGSVYIFTSTAPADIWEINQDKFFVILNSVKFVES